MIRKVLMSTVAVIAISGTAFAADLPSRRAPPVFVPPIPIFTWTGFYIGGQAGYVSGFTTSATTIPATGALALVTTSRPTGVIGGGHIGYNYQLPGFGIGIGSGLVVGVEGDVDGSDYQSTVAFAAANPVFGAGATVTSRNEIQGSIRGRLGVAFDRALFYATGGAAFGSFRDSVSNTGFGFDELNHTRVGYTVGGGIEYAITSQFSLRVEGRHTDFGTYTDVLAASAAGDVSRVRQIENRIQAGLSYKFEQPVVPVVARY